MSTQQNQPQAQTFEKHAEVVKFDSDRGVVVGACMVPWRVDKQNDFERPSTIRKLSDGYMEGLANGTAGNKVMHAVEASEDTLTHVENRVLDEQEEIGGKTFPAGSWIIGKRVKDDALKSLVENGALGGFSIGGRIHEAETYSPDDLPDNVETTKSDGDPIREITDATIEEVSLVDVPAVDDATITTVKSDGVFKANPALTESAEAATQYLHEERNHDPDAARELAEFLNRKESAASPTPSDGGTSWVSRAKSFFSRRDGGEMTDRDHEMTDDETEKAGRVLSGENVGRAMALHDIAIDMLDGTDVRQNRLRFTDDVSTDFDVAEFESKAADGSNDSPTGESGRGADADGVLESMTDDNEMDKFAELVAEKLREDGDNDDDDQTDEKNADGAGDDDQTEKVDDLVETVEQLTENQATILERIENAEGASQQKASASTNTGGETWGKSSPFAPAGAGAGGDE